MDQTENKVDAPPELRRNLMFAAAGGVAVVVCVAALLLNLRPVGPRPPAAAESAVAVSLQIAAPPAAPSPPPSFDIVRVDPHGGAVIAGRAQPDAMVTILDGATALGHVTTDESGQFVFIPNAPLPPGGRQLSLITRTPGGVEARSEGSVLLLVPERSQDAADQPRESVAVLTIPGAAPRLLAPVPDATPGAGPAAAHKRLGVDVVDYDDHGAIRFAGSGPSGGAVRLYVDNRPVGDAVADALGHWTMTPPDSLSPGPHRLRVDQLTAQGRVAARVEQPFQRVRIDPTTIGKDHVLVQPGQNLWSLARVVYGSGTRYTVIFQANRDQIRDPGLIYPGQAFSVPGSTPSDTSGSAKSR